MMNTPLAYEFHGLVFCTDCAWYNTRAASEFLHQLDPTIFSMPVSMDDAILQMATLQAIAGKEDDFPVPYTLQHDCDNCGKHCPAVQEASA